MFRRSRSEERFDFPHWPCYVYVCSYVRKKQSVFVAWQANRQAVKLDVERSRSKQLDFLSQKSCFVGAKIQGCRFSHSYPVSVSGIDFQNYLSEKSKCEKKLLKCSLDHTSVSTVIYIGSDYIKDGFTMPFTIHGTSDKITQVMSDRA